ncbi:MAG: CDP-glycerol glycerophosphotransferase family protein, partial [Bacteroidales bacterium]|nr:CDP-glycerol glycerophosphotransferase family protein [Bacteroidales bacterium]
FYIEDAINVIIVKMNSLNGFWLLTKCKVIFLQNSISMDYSLRWGAKLFSIIKLNLRKRIIIHLGHGIPLKKLSTLANPLVKNRADRVSFRRKERKFYSGLVTSSSIDSYAMATMFNPIKYENVWITGLPRNDFLIKELNTLPVFIRSQANAINKMKKGRKLITYTPTYRQTATVKDSSYYQFSKEEIDQLKSILIKHNAIFGFRMHYFRNNDNLFNMEKYIDNEYIFDLGHNKISEIAPVIRESDMIITDYSSVYIDALYINKPVFCFAYDLEQYQENQNGLLYDLDIVFPGPVASDFHSLINEINIELTTNTQIQMEKYKIARKIFFEYADDKNTERVIVKVKKALKSVE